MVALVIIMVLCLTESSVEAATYYIATTGSDSNSCVNAQMIGTPKQHFTGGSGAFACLSAGDTLSVRAGTYAENVIDPALADGTSWIVKTRVAAYNGETVWLAPTSGNFAIYFSGNQHYIEFDGVNLDCTLISNACVFLDERSGGNPNHIRIKNAEVSHRNTQGSDAGNAAVTVGGSDNEFINLNVHGTGGPLGFYITGNRNLVDSCDVHGVYSGGIQIFKVGGDPTDNTVRNTRVHDIHDAYFFSTHDHRLRGILMAGTTNTAYNNLVYDLGFSDTSWATWDNSAGIYLFGSTNPYVWNNTVANNVNMHGIYADGTSGGEVRNNIAYGNIGATDTRPAEQIRNTGTSVTVTTNDTTANPLFVNASTGDFRIAVGSPAIDQGTTIATVTSDFIQTSRPQGAAYDIGAYEFVTANPPPPPPPSTGPLRFRFNLRKP
jgi:parallel beta-helix repeat protein